jgi:hypothetical protein
MDSKLLRQERVVAFGGALVLAVGLFADALLFPESFERQTHTPVSIFTTLLVVLAHGIWISIDRTRRGREVGAWRFLAVLLAPLAIPLYLLLEYRARGLLYIVCYVALLAGAAGLGLCGAWLVFRVA